MTLSRNRYTARRNRRLVLEDNDVCHLCGLPGADTVDHDPPRKYLVAAGVPDPDAIEYLRPAHLKCNQRRGIKLNPCQSRRSRAW